MAGNPTTNRIFVRPEPQPNPVVDKAVAKARAKWLQKQPKDGAAAKTEEERKKERSFGSECMSCLKSVAACCCPWCAIVIAVRDVMSM